MPKLVSLPKGQATPTLAQLDPRGAFVIHSATSLYVWRGLLCPAQFSIAVERAARHLVRFEGAPQPIQHVLQGTEPAAFLAEIGPDGAALDISRISSVDGSSARSVSSVGAEDLQVGG